MAVRVHLCGSLRVEWDGSRLEPGLTTPQLQLLFAYLVLHRDRPVRRDELVEALWADGAGVDGEARLRPLLSRLRRALAEERLEGRATLALAFPADTWVDLEVAREGLAAARRAAAAGQHAEAWTTARTAVEAAGAVLLPGLEAPWLEPVRGELDDLRAHLLETAALAGAQLGAAELAEAEPLARRAVELSPYRESARTALITVLRRRGNTAEALVAYEELRRLLADELGSSPGPELRALHAELLRGERDAAPDAAPAGAPPLPDRLAQALTAPWVGRAEVLDRVVGAAGQAALGRTGLVLVTGDGGIGKTRLIAEAAARLPGFRVLYGRCDEDELSAYGPWVELLRGALADAGREVLDGAAALGRLLPEFREQLGEPPVTRDPEAQRRELFAAVAGVVARLATARPVLLVLDDLHWADRSSLVLARHVAAEPRLGPVLVMGTYRDSELGPGHPLPDALAALERDRAPLRLSLGGMGAGEVADLIDASHDGAVAGGTARAIHAETAGNPFFVKQLVRHLEETDGLGEEQPAPRFGVPQGVRDVIARRVARLPDGAGDVLATAALIGRDFDVELLERVVDLPEDALLDVLDAAVRGALLTEVPDRPGRCSFAHALLRTTLEGELTATRRARKHRRIGLAIEEAHGGALDPWLDDLARHFAAAGPTEADRAVGYAVRAAEQATARLAYDESVRLLERAAELRRDDPAVDRLVLAGLEHDLAVAQALAGQWQAARASFVRAAGAARIAGAAEAFARAALGHAGGTWEQYGTEDAAAVALLEEALDRLPDADAPLRAQVLARLAAHRYFLRDIPEEEVTATADEAVAMARRLGDEDALVAALAGAEQARWRPGRAIERLALAEELIALTEARDAPGAAAEAHLWRGVALLELCRLDEADAHLARHAELAEATRQPALLIQRDALRVTRALLEGDYERGGEAAAVVLDWAEREQAHDRTPSPLHAQTQGAHAVSLLNETGELGRFTALFERLAEQSVPPSWRIALAWSHVQAGRPDRGGELLRSVAPDGFATLPRDSNYVSRLAQVAHVLGELGDAELAREVEPLLAPHAGSWVVFGPGATTLGPVAYSVGLLRVLQERPDDAAPCFEQALELARRMRARPYVARAQAGLATALRDRDPARASALEAEATALARELGMTRLLRELA